MEFGLLGEVEAWHAGRPVDIGHARQRSVLAVLLVEANRVLHTEQLLDRVWADRRPQRADNALYSYLSRLRTRLGVVEGVAIGRRSGGYLLTVPPAAVDLHRFRELVVAAGATADDELALRRFDEALGLWRGEPFSGLDTPWFGSIRTALEQERMAAERDRTDVALRRGQHAALLPELLRSAGEQPLDERLAGQLMLALHRCGRQAEALDRFEWLRRELADSLGVDPGDRLRELHLRILDGGDGLAAPPAGPVVARDTAVTGAPRQLPPPPPLFVGRDRELAELTRALAGDPDRPGPTGVPVVAIGGAGGIGKSWLALRWAYQNLDRFPDGQLYVDLRGFDPSAEPTAPLVALRGLLGALGVPAASVPADLDARIGLYRSLVADRRMLVLLDNAHDAAQVMPLLPGGLGCAVLVTSRSRLGGLVTTNGATTVTLDVLSDDEARHVLSRRLDASRTAAEPGAVTELLHRCGGLPLALGIVAARAAMDVDYPLGALVDELAEQGTRLDALTAGDLTADLRAVFAASLRALDPASARVFALLGIAPGLDIGLLAAASLFGVPAASAWRVLRPLHEAHLIHQSGPGRYRMHDLVRLYAAERAREDQPAEVRRAARHRVLDHYLRTAHAAAGLLAPQRDPAELPTGPPEVTVEPPDSRERALAWFTAEHQALMAAVTLAEQTGFDAYAWQLAWAAEPFLDDEGHWPDWTASQLTALRAAERAGDRRWRANAHRSLGISYTQRGDLDDAYGHQLRARTLFEELGDLVSQAHTERGLGWVCDLRNRQQDTRDHNERALDLYRRAGHRTGEGMALNNLGWIHAQLGEHRVAISYCEQAIAVQQDLGDRHAEAGGWDSLGFVHHQLGEYEQAVTCFRRALKLVRGFHDQFNEADVLSHLGQTQLALGETAAARRSWEQALGIMRDIGHPGADEITERIRQLDRSTDADVA